MEKNVGGYDRIARLVLGPILVVVAAVGFAGLVSLAIGPIPAVLTAAVLGLVGLVFLVTGYTQQCPLNSVLGMNTYRGGADRETEPEHGRPSN